MTSPRLSSVLRAAFLILAFGVIVFAGIRLSPHPPAAPQKAAPDPLALILAPQPGSDPIDSEIVAAQRKARDVPEARRIEKLGWLFVRKARLSNDPGYYKLAEQCGLAMEAAQPNVPEGLLLRGHALEAMHHFPDAEKIARQLVLRREYVLDYALLGDALMEQGRVEEAIDAYQKMADLKPCLQVYARIAHVRWLRGDLEGAIEMAEEAVNTGNPRDPEPFAWVLTRLAAYRFESGDSRGATAAVDEALTRVPTHAAALLLRGRMLLAQDRAAEALPALRDAATRNPLPEYQWTLAEALRATGAEAEAAAVETELNSRGASEDPRTFALYLATRGTRGDEALRLAREELARRRDVTTYDTLAWACFASGRTDEALAYSRNALAEGTRDARLQLHAGLIAAAAGAAEAPTLLQTAAATRQTLLPSERGLLDHALGSLLSQQSNTKPKP